ILAGRRPARIPVVACVAGSQHADAVLDPGRQRPLPPAVHPVQLRPDRAVDEFRIAVRARRGPAEPAPAAGALLGPGRAARQALDNGAPESLMQTGTPSITKIAT